MVSTRCWSVYTSTCFSTFGTDCRPLGQNRNTYLRNILRNVINRFKHYNEVLLAEVPDFAWNMVVSITWNGGACNTETDCFECSETTWLILPLTWLQEGAYNAECETVRPKNATLLPLIPSSFPISWSSSLPHLGSRRLANANRSWSDPLFTRHFVSPLANIRPFLLTKVLRWPCKSTQPGWPPETLDRMDGLHFRAY